MHSYYALHCVNEVVEGCTVQLSVVGFLKFLFHLTAHLFLYPIMYLSVLSTLHNDRKVLCAAGRPWWGSVYTVFVDGTGWLIAWGKTTLAHTKEVCCCRKTNNWKVWKKQTRFTDTPRGGRKRW